MAELTDLEKLYIVWSMVNTAVLTFIAVYTWSSNRDKATRADNRQINDKVDALDKRTVALEAHVLHAPNKKDLAVLHKRITEMTEQQSTIKGEVHHMKTTLDLIHEHLLNRGQQ